MPQTPHILESALLLVATFLIGCVIGYVLRKVFAKPVQSSVASEEKRSSAPVAVTKPAGRRKATTTRKAVAGKDATPVQSDSAEDQSVDKNVTPDDLKKINGIGPKLEKQLNDSGVLTYAQIAGWSAHTIDEMDTRLGARGRIARQDWVRQAKALAKG